MTRRWLPPVWFLVGFGGFQVVWGAVLVVIGTVLGFVNIAIGAACLLVALVMGIKRGEKA